MPNFPFNLPQLPPSYTTTSRPNGYQCEPWIELGPWRIGLVAIITDSSVHAHT